jgi:hypothetical protein
MVIASSNTYNDDGDSFVFAIGVDVYIHATLNSLTNHSQLDLNTKVLDKM